MAYLVGLDGFRNRTIIGLLFFAFSAILSGLFFFQFIPRDIGRASSDFLFSINWVTGCIFLLFYVVQVVSWGNERGPLHTYLARPISRSEYVLGVFIGMGVLLFIVHLLLGSLIWCVLNYIQQLVGTDSFPVLSWFYFFQAELGLYCIHLVFLSVILLFSSAVRGSFSVLLLTLCYYFIGTGLPVVREALKENSIQKAQDISNILLVWLSAVFPDLSSLDFKNIIATSDVPPAATDTILSAAMFIVYITIVVWLACVIYERRDLQ
jgi:ABC-type transport system involved in multi-copper enzyme maturation permease subunit